MNIMFSCLDISVGLTSFYKNVHQIQFIGGVVRIILTVSEVLLGNSQCFKILKIIVMFFPKQL